MKIPRLLLVFFLLGIAGQWAQSAITWGPPLTISSDNDVRTDGILFGAINNGGQAVFTVSVNGVTFPQFATRGGSTFSLGHFTLAAAAAALDGLDAPGPTGTGVSAAYSTLLGGSSQTTGSPPTMTLSINDLSIGQLYLVQIWANDSIGPNTGAGGKTETLTASNSVTLRFNTSGSSGGRGQYATGTFTATSTSEAITITGASSNPSSFPPVALVSAVQVRALSTPSTPSSLVNISTRSHVETGDNALIGGFIIRGQASKRLLIRAIGPSLAQYGIPGVLADPVLDVYDQGGSVVAHNDNWRSTQEQEIINTGIPPTNDLESAIVLTIPPGNYTAIVKGANNGTGVGLVEVYDLQ